MVKAAATARPLAMVIHEEKESGRSIDIALVLRRGEDQEKEHADGADRDC